MLYIFSGLPGTGKTVLSHFLSKKTGATYLRIDTIEQCLRDRGMEDLDDMGYRIAYRLAEENLSLGLSVVADSVNPIEATRSAWRDVAWRALSAYCEIEVICSDQDEHRERIEHRVSDIPGLHLPGWEDVIDREYDDWMSDRFIIDTAGKSVSESLNELDDLLNSEAY